VDGLLRGDYQSRMNGYAVGRQNGWMSANDIRELENLDRIPEEEGGDLYLINGNMTKLERTPESSRRPHNAGGSLMKTGRNRTEEPESEQSPDSGKGGNHYDQKVLELGAKRGAGPSAATERSTSTGKSSDETWYGDEVTPQLFKDELNAGSGTLRSGSTRRAAMCSLLRRSTTC
jgi:hypothetical protein